MSENITLKEIVEITKGKLLYGDENEICEDFSRDTREISKDNIFIGIKGENYDGSNLYKKAFESGAKGCILNKNNELKIEKIDKKFVVLVNDTIEAIQKIATYKRKKYNIPVIAITGSVGKTSTKDIISSVVSEKYKVLKTQGNMNNHIGLPLTILKLKNHTAMIVEMGMNHIGEISNLTKIAKPNIAVITNIGTAHIGNLGSRENILKAKLEILDGLAKDGTLIINNDNDLLHKWYEKNNYKCNVVTYGIKNKSDNIATNIKYKNEESEFEIENQKIQVPVGGEAFVYNSLAGISVGKLLNIEYEKIAEGIKKFELTKMRLDIQKSNKGYIVLNDCYNANYDSMTSALAYLKNMQGNRKIAVLGDMKELGDFSGKLHKMVGKQVGENQIDILLTVGEESRIIAMEAKKSGISQVYEFNNNEEAVIKLKNILRPNDVVLIKASNSMNFNSIVKEIINNK